MRTKELKDLLKKARKYGLMSDLMADNFYLSILEDYYNGNTEDVKYAISGLTEDIEKAENENA